MVYEQIVYGLRKQFIGIEDVRAKPYIPSLPRPQLTLVPILSLSATMAINSELVGLPRCMLIV